MVARVHAKDGASALSIHVEANQREVADLSALHPKIRQRRRSALSPSRPRHPNRGVREAVVATRACAAEEVRGEA